jgi:hypothetical protein
MAKTISKPLNLPMSTTPLQAKANIAAIKLFMSTGQCGLDEGLLMIEAEEKFINTHVVVEMEADLKVVERTIEDSPPLLDVTVTQGLPELPGTNITMPPRRTTVRDNRWAPLRDRDGDES